MRHYVSLTTHQKNQMELSILAKAINVNEQFQVSMQFWSYLVNNKLIENPEDFIMPLPHMSMVQGEKNVEFLKKAF